MQNRNALRHAFLVLALVWPVLAQAGLVGRWPLDDGSGPSARDASGNGATGTLVGNTTWIQGRILGAVSCDGTGDAVTFTTTAAGPPTNTATYTAWIRKDASSTSFEGWFFNVAGGRGLAISGSDGLVLTYVWENTSDEYAAATGLTPTTGQWSLAAVVITPTAATVYLDAASFTNTKAHTTKELDDTHALCNDSRFAGRDAQISVDDARIYNHALSGPELTRLRLRGRWAR